MALMVNMHKAKSDLSQLVARARQGEEVVIMKAGKPVARLVAIPDDRVPGLAQGQVQVAPDFDAPLPDDLLNDFEGR